MADDRLRLDKSVKRAALSAAVAMPVVWLMLCAMSVGISETPEVRNSRGQVVDSPRNRVPSIPSGWMAVTTSAKQAIRMARHFDRTGDRRAAIEYYQKVIRIGHGSAEVAEAMDRIKALGG